MQENEFEKQVKNKMGELRFLPSESVWEAIKKQIEKKRRRILSFIFLLTIMAISGGFFIYISLNNNIKKQNKSYTALNNNDKQALANSNQNNSVQESTNMAATGLINQSQTAILNKDLKFISDF